MKLLTWNIQYGGGTRLARIVEEVAHDADVIALTEFRDRTGRGSARRAV
jgi:endonuclease/exonuclease/phosphatase family metal-dependent hydrolase